MKTPKIVRNAILLLGLLAAGTMAFTIQASAVTSFKDIKGHWAKTTIEWGVSQGIAKGYQDNTFQPNRNVTEAEFLKMLVIGVGGQDLEDTESDSWSEKYYVFSRLNNYPVNGFNSKDIRNKPVTRQKVAELIAAADGVNYTGDAAIQYVLGQKYAKGRIPNDLSVKSFVGKDSITRAEVLQLVRNLIDHGMTKLYERPEQPTSLEKLPRLPEPWDLFRDDMYMLLRKKVLANYEGYRIYDDGEASIVFTAPKNGATGAEATISVRFEPETKFFSKLYMTDWSNAASQKLAIDVLKLYGFEVDDKFIDKMKDAEKTGKEVSVKIGDRVLSIDPHENQEAGKLTVYYPYWQTK